MAQRLLRGLREEGEPLWGAGDLSSLFSCPLPTFLSPTRPVCPLPDAWNPLPWACPSSIPSKAPSPWAGSPGGLTLLGPLEEIFRWASGALALWWPLLSPSCPPDMGATPRPASCLPRVPPACPPSWPWLMLLRPPRRLSWHPSSSLPLPCQLLPIFLDPGQMQEVCRLRTN